MGGIGVKLSFNNPALSVATGGARLQQSATRRGALQLDAKRNPALPYVKVALGARVGVPAVELS